MEPTTRSSDSQPAGRPSEERRPEPPYELIRDRLLRGKVIPFLGAGVSLGCRPESQVWTPESPFLPSALELASHLDRRSGYPSVEPDDLTRIAQYFDGVAGRGGLDDELHAVFSRTCAPTPVHYFLARIPGLLIVTTNYDDLLERAFREQSRPFHLVSYRTVAATPGGVPTFLLWEHGATEPVEQLAHEFTLKMGEIPVIFKMHGTCDPEDFQRDSYVITEDDYVEFLSRMTTQTAIPAIFARSFRESHFLFLGYGLRDWNLRVILHKIWNSWPRRYASWAIQHRTQPLEREFWSRRSLTIYEMTIDTFLSRIQANER